MNRTAKICKFLLYIFNVILAGFGLFYIIVGSVMTRNIKSSEFIGDAKVIPITVLVFGTIMVLLSCQSFYGLTIRKPGYLTSNAVLNLIFMLLHIYFTCYLWLGLSAKVVQANPYFWDLGVNITKCSIFIPIALELVTFSISCYVADVMRNSQSLIDGSPYASFLHS